MKKIILLFSVQLMVMPGFAQPEKGKKLLGGSISLSGNNFTSGAPDESNRSFFNLSGSPRIGYFLNDHFALGVQLNTIFSSVHNEYTHQSIFTASYKEKTLSYGGGIFFRYYNHITGNLYFMLDNTVSYTYGLRETENKSVIAPVTNDEYTVNQIGLSIRPGLVYFVTPKLGLEASFIRLNGYYDSVKNKETGSKTTEVMYRIDLNESTLFLGFHYYF